MFTILDVGLDFNISWLRTNGYSCILWVILFRYNQPGSDTNLSHPTARPTAETPDGGDGAKERVQYEIQPRYKNNILINKP